MDPSDSTIDTGQNAVKKAVYMCQHCNFVGYTTFQLLIHIERHHLPKEHECQVCGRRYGGVNVLREHLRLTHLADKTTTAVCDLCGKTVLQIRLRRHIRLRHKSTHERKDATDRPLKCCEHCDYATTKSVLMKRHVERRHGTRDKICALCSKAFATTSLLTQHIRTLHSCEQVSYTAREACPTCFKTMLTRNLAAHIKNVHTKVRDFICGQCGHAFQTRHALTVHARTHAAPGDRLYKFRCEDCGVGFDNRRIYNDHLNIHTGLKPYSCTICSKTFRQLNVFRRHSKLHQKGKAYSCDACEQIFGKRAHLNKHKRTDCRGYITAAAEVSPTTPRLVLLATAETSLCCGVDDLNGLLSVSGCSVSSD